MLTDGHCDAKAMIEDKLVDMIAVKGLWLADRWQDSI